MGVGSFTIALALLLLLHIHGGKAQITCHNTSNCSDSGSSDANHRDCCLRAGTVAYNDGTCKQCIVLGWTDAKQKDGSIIMNPSRIEKETTSAYKFSVSYMKGRLQFTQFTIKEYFRDKSDPTSAQDSDTSLLTENVMLDSSTPLMEISETLSVDNLAMEPLEDFILSLSDTLSLIPQDAIFIQNLTVRIIDNDNVTIQFTEDDYQQTEGRSGVFSVVVSRPSDKGVKLANPIHFQVIPLSYETIMRENIKLPDGFPQRNDSNPNTPIFAKDNLDFNSSIITGVFTASDDLQEEILTPIPFVDDEIDEVEQYFVARLNIVNATNPERVNIDSRPFTECIINDNDDTYLSFEKSHYTVNENNTEGTLSIKIIKQPIDATETEITYTVSIKTKERGAVEEVDFSIGASDLQFGIGEIRRELNPLDQNLVFLVNIFDDILPESTERFELEISSVTGQQTFQNGMHTSTTVEIIDDDVLIAGFVETEKVVPEGETFIAQVILKIEDVDVLPSNIMIRINLRTVDDTATAPQDYVAIVPANNPLLGNPLTDDRRIQNITVKIQDDDSFEEDEVFTLTIIRLPNSIATLFPHLYTVTIKDNDNVTIGFEKISYNVSEDGGQVTLNVVVYDGAIGTPITLSILTADDSADSSDYSSLSNYEFTMATGVTSFEVSIDITDDSQIEMLETFTASLGLVSPISDRITINPDAATISIIDNDVRFGFEQTVYMTSERTGYVVVCAVVEEGTVNRDITLLVEAMNNTADYISDYTPEEFEYNFLPGESRKCINMTIVSDRITEATESFYLTMTSNHNGVTIGNGMATVNIAEDPEAIVGLEMTLYTFDEDVGSQEICVVVISPSGSCPISFGFDVNLQTIPGSAVSPMDYDAVSTTLSFDACAQKVCINVTIVDDDAPEGMENFSVQLMKPVDLDSDITLNPISAELQIIDNDDVEIGWERTVYYVNETFGRVEVCGIVYNMMLSRSVTVHVETSDGTAMKTVNYQPVNMTLGPFTQPGEKICFDINIHNNLLCNNDLSFTVVMSSPDDDVVITLPVSTVFIDDSREPECEPIRVGYKVPSYNTSEGDGSKVICAVIYEPATGGTPRSFVLSTSTEDGTAIAGADYVAVVNQQLQFNVGDTEICYAVIINQDDMCENNPNENFFVNLEYESGILPITVSPHRANVVVDDDGEVECVVVYVNDTIVGDPLFHVPIKSPNSPLKDVGLCYEIHGEKGYYFNLVSDSCTSVNAHWIDVTSTLNVIDEVAIRTVDNDNKCKNITISLDKCSASVDGTSIASSFKSGGISLEKTRSNRWQIIVPNCHSVRLEMWVTCEHNTLTNPGTDTTIEADMIKFVVERGLNAGRLAHGLIGQFWNREVSVKDYTGPKHPSVADLNHYTVTMPQGRNFTAIHHDVNWIWERVNCLYAGNHQGGPIYEVADPNDPVIAGSYTNYIVPGPFSEEGYKYGAFDTSKCK